MIGNHTQKLAMLPWLLAVLLLCLPGTPTARAQEPTSQPETERSDPGRRPRHRDSERGRPRDQHERPEGDEHRGPPPDGKHGPRWPYMLLEPAPEDRGPLQPGEAEELRAFVAKEMPRLNRLLDRIEEKSPKALSHGSARLIARLRQLRRIHAEDPELAELIARHAGNLFSLEMLRRGVQRLPEDQQEPLLNQMRTYLADNIDIEAQVLERWANKFETNRDAFVQRRVADLTGPDADLSAEPARIREAVEKVLAETDATQQVALKAALTDLLTKQADKRIATMREQVRRLRDEAADEVDRRLEHMSRKRERGPRRERPPRP
ncbi:MAG: hypothetical protein PVJ57_17040 [Phycisphaerae bacterium]|jgi:hypothetical protein